MRPKIATSKMAETLITNLPIINNMWEDFPLRQARIQLERVSTAMMPFNFKDEPKPDKQDLKEFVKAIINSDNEIIDKIQQLGLAMYVSTIHVKMAKFLITNTATYASKLQLKDGSDSQFKLNPNFRELIDFCSDQILTPKLEI